MSDRRGRGYIISLTEGLESTNVLLRQKKYKEASKSLDKLISILSILISTDKMLEWDTLIPPKEKLDSVLYKIVLELLNNKILSLCNHSDCDLVRFLILTRSKANINRKDLASTLFRNYVIWRPFLARYDEKSSKKFGLRDLNVFSCAWRISQLMVSHNKDEYLSSFNLRVLALKFLHSHFYYEQHCEKFYLYTYKAAIFLKSFINDKYITIAHSLYTEINLLNENLFEPNLVYPSFATHLLDCLIHMGEVCVKLNNFCDFKLAFKKALEVQSKIEWENSQIMIIYQSVIYALLSWSNLKEYEIIQCKKNEDSLSDSLCKVNNIFKKLTESELVFENLNGDSIDNLLKICIYLKDWLEWSVKLLSSPSFELKTWTRDLSDLLVYYQKILNMGTKIEANIHNYNKSKFQPYIPIQVWSLSVAATLILNDKKQSRIYFESAFSIVKKLEFWNGLKYIYNGLNNSSFFLRCLSEVDGQNSEYYSMAIHNLEWSVELHEMYLAKSGDTDVSKLHEKKQNLYRLKIKFAKDQKILELTKNEIIYQIKNFNSCSYEKFEYLIKNYCSRRIKCPNSVSLCSLLSDLYSVHQIPGVLIGQILVFEFKVYITHKEIDLLSQFLDDWKNSSFKKQEKVCYVQFLIHKALYYRFVDEEHFVALELITEAINTDEKSKDLSFQFEILLARGWRLVLTLENPRLLESFNNSNSNNYTFLISELSLFLHLWTEFLKNSTECSINQCSRTLNLFETLASLFRVYGDLRMYIICLKFLVKILKIGPKSEEIAFQIRFYYAQIANTLHEMGYSDPLASKYFDRAKISTEESLSTITSEIKKLEMYVSVIDFNFQIKGISRTNTIYCLNILVKDLVEKSKNYKTVENHQMLSLIRFRLASILFLSGRLNEAIVESRLALKLRRELLPQIYPTLASELNSNAKKSSALNGLAFPCCSQWILVFQFIESLEKTALLYQLQGSILEAEYYLKIGIKLANILSVEYVKYRFLVNLQNLYVKIHRDEPEVLKELYLLHMKFLNMSSQPYLNRTISVVSGILLQGDISLLSNLENAREFYDQAEDYLFSLVDYSYLETFEDVLLSSEVIKDYETHKKVIFRPRLSFSPFKLPGDLLSKTLPHNYRPLKKIQFGIKIKIGLARYLRAISANSLDLMRTVFDYFLDVLEQLESFTPHKSVAEEKAILLLHLSKALIFINNLTIKSKHSRMETVNNCHCGTTSDLCTSLWKLNSPLKNSSVLKKARDYLIKGFKYCQNSGSVFKVTSEISYELAILTGYQDPYSTVYYLNYSLGLTFRHQMVSNLYENLRSDGLSGDNRMDVVDSCKFGDRGNGNELIIVKEGSSLDSAENSFGEKEKPRFERFLDSELYHKRNSPFSFSPSSNSKFQDKFSNGELADEMNFLIEKTNCGLNIGSHKPSQSTVSNYADLVSIFDMGSVSKFKSHYFDLLNSYSDCKAWTICTLSLDLSSKYLILSRIEGGREPLIKRLDLNNSNKNIISHSSVTALAQNFTKKMMRSRSSTMAGVNWDELYLKNDEISGSLFDLLWSQFQDIIKESRESALLGNDQSSITKTQYWKKRIELDARLGLFLGIFEQVVLGPWRFLMLGRFENASLNEKLLSKVLELSSKIESMVPNIKIGVEWLQALVASVEVLEPEEVKEVLRFLFNMKDVLSTRNETILDCITKKIVDCYLITIKDFKNLEKVNDSILIFDAGEIAEKKISRLRRQGTILILDKMLHQLPWECLPSLKCAPISRIPSLAFIRARILQNIQSDVKANVLRDGIDVKNASYVLNPSGDLLKTQEILQSMFMEQKLWHGIIGEAPTEERMIDFLTNYHLFIYCGHNAGEKYLRRNMIQNIKSNVGGCVTLLMGCASLGIEDNESYDPSGLAFSYIISGCAALVGNLWTVTSGDLDISTKKLLEWVINEKKQISLLEALQEARSEKNIKLKYLNAAALICYGLPVKKKCK